MKQISLFAVVLAIVAFMWCSTPVKAEEVLTFKAESVSVLKDKNGNEYVRMIYSVPTEKDGIKYNKSVSANAYRELVSAAKAFKAGDTVKAVVQKREYNGNEYLTIMAFAPATAKKQ